MTISQTEKHIRMNRYFLILIIDIYLRQRASINFNIPRATWVIRYFATYEIVREKIPPYLVSYPLTMEITNYPNGHFSNIKCIEKQSQQQLRKVKMRSFRRSKTSTCNRQDCHQKPNNLRITFYQFINIYVQNGSINDIALRNQCCVWFTLFTYLWSFCQLEINH